MRIRPWTIGAALLAVTAAAPASATHAPFYGWMGIVEISSTAAGTNVSYSYSGFAPTNWSAGCFVSQWWTGTTTTVSCTPPTWPGTDVNYCAILSVVASSTAPSASPGTVSGASTCDGVSANAAAPAGGTNASGNSFVSNLQLDFPWTCTATAPPTVHPWTVRCTVTH